MFARFLSLAFVSSTLAFSGAASAAPAPLTSLVCNMPQGVVSMTFRSVDGQTADGKNAKAVLVKVGSAQFVFDAAPFAPLFKGDLGEMDGVQVAGAEDTGIMFERGLDGGFGRVSMEVTLVMKSPETGKPAAQVLPDCQMGKTRVGFL